MANPNTSALILDSSIQGHKEISDPYSSHPPQLQNSLDGPVAILWDIENCPVPNDVRPEDVGGNIRMALQVHPIINGAVTMFSAYGDFNAFPRRLREGCQRTGVKLIDVPNGRKDAADKAILVDMFLFALDNRTPSSIMLISGDVDFAPALHILGQRGYTVILVIPSGAGVGISSALINAGRFVWDWPSVVCGEGFGPPAKPLIPPQWGSGAYVPKMRSHSLASGLSEVSAGPVNSCEQNALIWVQPGDLNGLKGQLVKLLELSEHCMPLNRITSEYQKYFGRPLFVSEYGTFNLVNLLKKMAGRISVVGKGQGRFVYLRVLRAGPRSSPSDLAKSDKKGKGTILGLSDKLSDNERVVEENEERRVRDYSELGMVNQFGISDHFLNQFRYEVQEILVSYYCGIYMGCFEAIYQQRYKKPLEYKRFGVNELDELFEKLRDIVVLREEPASKKKFLTAAGY